MRAPKLNPICIFIFFLFQLCLPPCLMFSQTSNEIGLNKITPFEFDSLNSQNFDNSFKIGINQINLIPVRETRDLLKFLPGVTEHKGKLNIKGSRFDETDYSVDDISIYDFVSGEQFIEIPKFALNKIELRSSGFQSKQSNNASNLVNYELKSGGDQLNFNFEHITDNIGFNNKDFFYIGKERLGTYWYGYNESNFNAQGPIVENRLKFFTNLNYKFLRDRNPQLYPGVNNFEIFDVETLESGILNMPKGIVFGNSEQSYNLIGKLDYSNNDLKITATGIFDNNIQDAPRNHILDYFNKRLGKFETNTGFFSLSMDKNISKNISFNVSGSYSFKNTETYDEYLKDDYWSYGDSVANANAGANWVRTEEELERWNGYGFTKEVTRYFNPGNFYYNGFPFDGVNSVPVNYSKKNQRKISFGGEVFYNLSNNNVLSIGISRTQLVLRNWETLTDQDNLADRLHRNLKYWSDPIEEIKKRILKNELVNNYGYDLLGNEINEGFDAPYEPSFTNIFIKNKFNIQDFTINLELRYNSFNLDNNIFVNPHKPELSYNYLGNGNTIPNEKGFKKSPVRDYFSPLVNINYSLSKESKLNLLLGKFITQPELSRFYYNPLYFHFMDVVHFQNYNEFTVNNDVKPVNTKKIELGYSFTTNNIIVKIDGFMKKIENQIIPKFVPGSNFYFNYLTATNEGSSTVGGLLFHIGLPRSNGFSVKANTSYLSSRGTKYFYYYHPWVGMPLTAVDYAPLDYQKSISSALEVDYLLEPELSKYSILDNLSITLLVKYNSGHPYTLYESRYDVETNPYIRSPLHNSINNFVSPSNFQVNFKLEKSFVLPNYISANIYIYALNLFNNVNVIDEFLITGNAKDDGDNIHPNEIEAFGQNYVKIHKLVNVEYNPKNGQQNLFAEPRQIIMGIKLNI